MSRQEFLNALQGALTGRVNASQIAENINYYDDYISTQMRMGRSEEEVIAELGSPRLLAKSIVEASRHADGNAAGSGYGNEQSDYENMDYDSVSGYGKVHKRRIPVWLIVVLVILALLAILSMVFSAFVFLAPVLLPILFVVIVMKIMERSS